MNIKCLPFDPLDLEGRREAGGGELTHLLLWDHGDDPGVTLEVAAALHREDQVHHLPVLPGVKRFSIQHKNRISCFKSV